MHLEEMPKQVWHDGIRAIKAWKPVILNSFQNLYRQIEKEAKENGKLCCVWKTKDYW
jgi:hypothetical protein